jgi:hypothetical protein
VSFLTIHAPIEVTERGARFANLAHQFPDIVIEGRSEREVQHMLHDLLVKYAHEGLTIPMMREPRFSATTAKNTKRCQRIWFWEYLLGIELEPTEAMLFGTALHKVCEDWLKEGKAPSKFDIHGRTASPGLQYLPGPMSFGLHVEDKFEFLAWPNGPTVTGTIDCWIEPSELEMFLLDNVDSGIDDKELTEMFRDAYDGDLDLYDHKTTSDFKWRLREDDCEDAMPKLRDDVQCNLYALALLKKYPKARGVRAHWIYYRKNQHPSAMLVETYISREDAMAKWVEIQDVLDTMNRMLRELPALAQVPPSLDECEAYRGCAHKARCFPNPAERAKTTFAAMFQQERDMNFKEQLEKEIAAKKAGTAGKTAAPTTTAAKPVAAKPAAAPVKPAAPAAKPALGVPKVAPKVTGGSPAAKLAATAPKAAPAPAPEPEEVPEEQEEQQPETDELVQEAEATPEAEQTDEAPEPKAKRGRKAKGFWLFVGCTPTKGGSQAVTNADDIVAPIASKIAEELGLSHFRLAEYNKAGEYLAVALNAELDAQPLSGAVYLDPLSFTAKAVLDVLTQRADVVVRSVA